MMLFVQVHVFTEFFLAHIMRCEVSLLWDKFRWISAVHHCRLVKHRLLVF